MLARDAVDLAGNSALELHQAGKFRAVAAGVVALGVLGAILSDREQLRDPGPPARVMRCESDGDYRHCRADVQVRVSLRRQLSRADCRYNDTWGYDRRGVWVDGGCRAEFALD